MFFKSAIIERLKADHDAICEKMARLKDRELTLRDRRRAFVQLVPILKSHSEREERDAFPKLKKALDSKGDEELARKYE